MAGQAAAGASTGQPVLPERPPRPEPKRANPPARG